MVGKSAHPLLYPPTRETFISSLTRRTGRFKVGFRDEAQRVAPRDLCDRLTFSGLTPADSCPSPEHTWCFLLTHLFTFETSPNVRSV